MEKVRVDHPSIGIPLEQRCDLRWCQCRLTLQIQRHDASDKRSRLTRSRHCIVRSVGIENRALNVGTRATIESETPNDEQD